MVLNALVGSSATITKSVGLKGLTGVTAKTFFYMSYYLLI